MYVVCCCFVLSIYFPLLFDRYYTLSVEVNIAWEIKVHMFQHVNIDRIYILFDGEIIMAYLDRKRCPILFVKSIPIHPDFIKEILSLIEMIVREYNFFLVKLMRECRPIIEYLNCT